MGYLYGDSTIVSMPKSNVHYVTIRPAEDSKPKSNVHYTTIRPAEASKPKSNVHYTTIRPAEASKPKNKTSSVKTVPVGQKTTKPAK